MAYQTGDIVLVPFPFTDLSAARVRPALLVSSTEYNRSDDVIVAMITSQQQTGVMDTRLQDWRRAGLLYPSWVRMKLATLAQRLIQFSPGRVSARDGRSVEASLRRALGWQGPFKPQSS